MSDHILPMILLFGVTLAVSFALTPLVRRFALRRGLVDKPGEERRVHRVAVPRLGGLAIYAAFAIGIILYLVLYLLSDDSSGPIKHLTDGNNVYEMGRVVLMLIGAGLLTVVMAVDDVRGIKPIPKLLWQVGAAMLVLVPSLIWPGSANPGDSPGTVHYDQGAGVLSTSLQNPFGGTLDLPLVIAVLFTVVWMAGMSNAINWIDGLDGLAAGVSLVACVVLFIVTLFPRDTDSGQYTLAYLPLILGAAILGFLPFNIHPARIFMGDSGAMFLGFTLAVLSIIGGAKIAAALLVLGIPLLDAAYLIIYRLLRGRSPMSADRGHLHHRLLDIGLSQQQVVMVFYALSIMFGVLAFLLPSGLFKLYALIVMVIVLVALLVYLARRRFDTRKL